MQHYPEREPPRPGLALSFLLAALVLAVFLPLWAGLYTDLRWFRSLGHGSVFATILRTRLTVGGISGLAFAGFLYAQGRLALRLSARFASPRPRTPNGLATPPLDLGNWAPRIVAPVSILAGVVYVALYVILLKVLNVSEANSVLQRIMQRLGVAAWR